MTQKSTSMLHLSDKEIAHFQKHILDFYREHERSFAWRNTSDAYHIVVSEIMLQQTQTDRVAKKYESFLAAFPTVQTLSQAPLSTVIAQWQGLGYNRRAIALKELAQRVVHEFDAIIPSEPDILVTFRGIGPATAASICAFAFNRPTVFIETNIRAVFIHHFFKGKTEVHDRDLVPLVAQTLDFSQPRQWYYALMDYGVHLKKTLVNPSRRSAHHTKQSRFEGSDRQIRGAILRLLLKEPCITEESLINEWQCEENRIQALLHDLEHEGFIKRTKTGYSLS